MDVVLFRASAWVPACPYSPMISRLLIIMGEAPSVLLEGLVLGEYHGKGP